MNLGCLVWGMFTAGANINQDAQFRVPCLGLAMEKRVSISIVW